MNLDPIFTALLDDGRFLQGNLLFLGTDHAVPPHPYRSKCIPHPFILFFQL